jgi:phage host-nuclease inhibitor protein Gam
LTLPSQLQKQVDEGNRLIAEIQPQLDPASDGTTTLPVVSNDDDPAPQDPAPAPAPEPQGDAWEARYKVLQGKYNKEVPRLTRDLGELREQLGLMTNQMRELTAAPKQYNVDIESIAAEVPIHQEEVDEYGEELLDLMGRRALQAVLPEIRRIEARIEEIARNLVGVNSSVEVNHHEKFLQRLDTEHKAWRKLNTDEGFLDWLEELDPFTGVARKHLLEDAVKNKDAERALTFFRAFEGDDRKPAAAAPAAKRQQETAMARMAAPGQGRTASATSAPQEPELWTRSDIGRFYADVRKGVFRGREAEKDQIERSIIAAAAQNRVVQA